MASSSSNQGSTDNTPQSTSEQTKNCLPSTSRGKCNNSSTAKNKIKFPQFHISSPQDASVFLSGDTNFQGIDGMDISYFQNYLSSRSLASNEVGDQINKKLEELRSSSNDRTQEYMIMSEINQHLLVSYENSLNFLRVAELVTQVVGLIQNCEDNLVDLKNICYNVLLHMMEALPRSSDYLVSSLSMFLNKISNFDSLEQIINVIERVSRRHGQAVLQCGAFTIILNYYDFLTVPQQLTILNMISQCFHNLKPTDFNYIIDGIENLSNRLKQSESKCVDKVIQCFVKLVNAFQGDELKLKKLASNNLFFNVQELLICSPPVISDIHEIVQMLAVLCANCADLAVDLIKQNITQTILCVCNNVSSDIVTHNVSNCNNRSVEEILALVNLISELMPPLPLNDDLFIINKLINSNVSLTKSLKTNTFHEHIWYWYNASTKQWVSHPHNVCHLLEKTLNANEFEVTCQSNGVNVDINLITMEQSHQCNRVLIISDIKRSRHQVKHSLKSNDYKVDSRKHLLYEQCSLFENNEVSIHLEAIDSIRHLLPLLIDIYNEASSHQVRYKCLEAMMRMIYPTSNKVLNNVLNKASLSNLMASLLTSHDSTILINSIQIGTIIKRLPATLILNFKKEGVLYQLNNMLSNWRVKMCDFSMNHKANTMLLSTDSNISMTVSAPSNSLDPLTTEQSTDYTNISSLHNYDNSQVNHCDIVKLDQGFHHYPDVTQLPAVGSSTNTSHRFTNWILKRSGCIGRPVTNDADEQNCVKSSKHRVTPKQTMDIGAKTTLEQANYPTNTSSNKRINKIMSTLNLNSSFSNDYHPYDNKADRTFFENKKRELYCNQWIVKFGTKLYSDWKQIGDDSLNEKISSITTAVPKKDILYYLKEIVCGLRLDNTASIKKALTLYAELLTTDCYISVFEMEVSSINEVLLEFFTNASSNESKRDHFLMFINIFNNGYCSNKGTVPTFKKPFVSLVNHLLMCLHQQEQFHVRMSQLPTTLSSNVDTSSSKNGLQSRYTLTQFLTDAVLGRISSSRQVTNSSLVIPRNVDPPMFEARLLPNLLLDSSLSRMGSKVTEVNCHFSPYIPDTHPTDSENSFELWNNGEFLGFNTNFNVTLDVIGTIASIEKVVMREISRNRRINKRFGVISKEIVSVNDSSDSDDGYRADIIEESLLSGEIKYHKDVSDFAEISFTNNPVKKLETLSEKLNSFNLFNTNSVSESNTKSVYKKSRNKTNNLLKAVQSTSTKLSGLNSLSKTRDNGLKTLASKRSTRESQNDSESPSTSSSCTSTITSGVGQAVGSTFLDLHGKYTEDMAMKPISKIQILIGDIILPSDMTLYQAIRRYSSHVTQFMANFKNNRTDQEMEEAINQIIWKSTHNINYRQVSSIHQSDNSYRQSFSSNNTDSVSTLNFMASLLNSHSHKFSHFTTDHSKQQVDQLNSSVSNSNINSSQIPFVQLHSINSRHRSFHRKLTTVLPTVDQNSSLQTLRHKRRRKNNSDSFPSIGRSVVYSDNVLFTHMTQNLPYPTLIDFPTIFEPIPISTIRMCESKSPKPCKLHYDLNSNMSVKLETTLSLLRCLYFINRDWHVLSFSLNSNSLISEMEFRSQKLSSKANRQLQDTFYVLARNIPFWCVQLFHTCAFLFSLETRQNFLYLFNFDRARTLLYLEGVTNQDTDSLFDSFSSEIRRIRVQVNRSDRLLEESELLLKNHTNPRILLEISFNNEAGFGLGPTNEFYTQVSKCLMKSDLMLWYSSTELTETYVMPHPAGLYPRPIFNRNKKLDNKIRNKFVFLGRFMARALLDCRKIDLPLNPVFYKWLLNQEDTINSADIFYIDPNLASQLKSLHDIVNRQIIITSDKTISPANKMEALMELNVEDLQIVFVHPIYTNLELLKDGINRIVTLENLSFYLDLIASFTLIDGVRSQMECVIEGFDSLLPGARMHLAALFEAHEMEEIFCGGNVEDNQAWDVKTLTECCVCDHGYTMNSKSIVNLFEIMSEFTKEQRRYFVQFCTGTPRLPVGGFRALKPPFKIVNKKEGENPDNYLPSVMTCQNFLKLPDYSSKEVMRERMLYALHEGQNAFFLS